MTQKSQDSKTTYDVDTKYEIDLERLLDDHCHISEDDENFDSEVEKLIDEYGQDYLIEN